MTRLSRECLFCSEVGTSRDELFSHMLSSHGFNIGSPDNVVDVAGFLDVIKAKLDQNVCLYCEKIFRDRPTLKDHMRKKQHRKLNPKNREYDQFYLINYVELGKNWESLKDGAMDPEREGEGGDDPNWDDWVEEGDSQSYMCLFCNASCSSADSVFQHMKSLHEFDLPGAVAEFDFYAQVKIVNFVRRCVHGNRCVYCNEEWKTCGELMQHLEEMRHFKLPQERSLWDQPQYFFPTYENDMLLSALEDTGIEGTASFGAETNELEN
eukprot:m.56262 g.56262  ORF g.56262 m.56262 type:complete len:266 (+) comp34582_c0_seq1:443-1240(+)